MNAETELLNRLCRAREQYALRALQCPQTRDTFEYGLHVGVMQGYALAIEELEKMVADVERDANL